jgi:hypothetical protein
LNESRGLSLRSALTACALAAPPEFQPPRSKRRMSLVALVTFRRPSDRDKTRVSSINKRRVTSVPEEAAASTGIEIPGLEGSGSPLEVWTRRSPRVARPCSDSPGGGSGAAPVHDRGCVFWLTTERLDCLPLSPRRGARLSADNRYPRRADPGGPPPSGPVPAPSLLSHRSTGSSTVGAGPRASTASDSILTLNDISQAAFASSGTPHDDAIPDDLSPLRALARPSGRSRHRPEAETDPRRPVRRVSDRREAAAGVSSGR